MADGEGKKSFIKLILMGVVVLVVLGGGVYGGIVIAGKMAAKKAAAAQADPAKAGEAAKDEKGKDHAAKDEKGGHGEEEDEDDAHGGDGHGGAAAAPAVLTLRPIVNLEGPRKNSFLKCELHILFRDPELGRLVTGDKPTAENSQVRALVLEMLSGKTLEEARDVEFRESLRLEIKEKLNLKFAPKPPKPGEKEDPKKKKPKRPIKDVLVVDWGIQE